MFEKHETKLIIRVISSNQQNFNITNTHQSINRVLIMNKHQIKAFVGFSAKPFTSSAIFSNTYIVFKIYFASFTFIGISKPNNYVSILLQRLSDLHG